MIAGALEVQMFANLARLQADMAGAKTTVDSAMGSVRSAVGTAQTVLGSFGIALSVNYFKTMITNSIEAQSEMFNLSQKIGITVEDLAGLSYAAKLADVGPSTLEKGLRNLSIELIAARNSSSSAATTFKNLGIDIKNSNGDYKSLKDIVYDIAENFYDMEDGIIKTDAAASLMGKTVGAEWIPFLNSGAVALQKLVSEGTQFSGMTTKNAAEAEELGDDLEKIALQWQGLANAATNILVPAISGALSAANWLGKQIGIIVYESGQSIKTGFNVMTDGLASLSEGAEKARITAMNSQSAIAAGIPLEIPAITSMVAQMRAASLDAAKLANGIKTEVAAVGQMTYRSEGFVGPFQEMSADAVAAGGALGGLIGVVKNDFKTPIEAAGASAQILSTPMASLAPSATNALVEIKAMGEGMVQQKDPIDTYRNMIQGVQQDWSTLIYQTLRDGKLNFKDFFDSVLDGFLRMIAQMAAADLADAVFGGGGLGSLTNGTLVNAIKNGINFVTGGGSGGAGVPGSSTFVGPLMQGASGAGAGALASIGGGIASTASSIWGGLTGAAGSIGGGIAGAGSAVMSALSAIPGWGWALAGLGLAASALDSGGTYSHNAGFMLRPVGGDQSRFFDVPAFDSGFDPVGFNRRTSVQEATAVIDTFRTYDSALTRLARGAGLAVNYANAPFGGYDEKGFGNGLFFGSAEEDDGRSGTALNIQLNKYVADWVRALGYQIDPSISSAVLSAGDADSMVAMLAQHLGVDGSHAGGLNFVPFDNYRANLHRGERVQTAAEARNSDQSVIELRDLKRLFSETLSEMQDMKRYIRELYLVNDKWDGDGLPAERV